MTKSARQARFIQEYVVDLSAKEAAIRAGYSKHSAKYAARDLLERPEIIAAIDKKLGELAKRADLSAEWVVNELRDNHFTARRVGEIAASNKALELIGRHLGMWKGEMGQPAAGGNVYMQININDNAL